MKKINREKSKHNSGIRSAVKKLMTAVDIPPVSIGLESRIEMCGTRKIAVDGCIGVNEYDRDCIQLELCDGQIHICGENMFLSKYGEGRVTVEGSIISVNFENYCGTNGRDR